MPPTPASPDEPARSAHAVPRLPTGLRVEPFVGVRYDPRVVGDLAGVTSPPYDVMDRADVLAHELHEAHNVVRLVRPRADGCGPEGPYDHAAALLAAWLTAGVLRVDAGRSLYAYEQGTRGDPGWQRGVLAAVGLGPPAQSAVVPHEDVMPGPVEDRRALMQATRANLEPILLLHDGPATSGERVEEILTRTCAAPPLADLVDEHARPHRLWRVASDDVDALRAAFARRGALIADGHHRWEAYGRLREADPAAGPLGSGLALLVDAARYPTQLGAIHRCIAGLPLASALAALDPAMFEILGHARAGESPAIVLAGPAPPGGQPPADVLVRPHATPRVTQLVRRAYPGRSVAFLGLPAALLHGVLLPLWGLGEERVSYHHDPESAREAARASDGTAVLLEPTSLASVLDVVAAGETMPRKSTSFGPKPLTGLVLRLLWAPDPSALG